MIFLIRFITAACLFAFLGKANVWLTPLSNVILAIGYRLFLILSPIFDKVAGKFAVTTALIFAAMGSLLFTFHQNSILIIGALMVGIGLSVSGYLIKAQAAETPKGAAHNKIALNAGSLISGIILLLAINSKSLFFSIGAFILFASSLISLSQINKKHKEITLTTPQAFSIKKSIAWVLVGIAVGIKLFGVFSVLPQYLIQSDSYLPKWYGLMIFLNSSVVIFCQLPIIHWLERFKENNHASKIVFCAMILGMLFIGFPQFFHIQHIINAIIWTVLLSIIECFASYLDVHASRAKFLLIKETAVGIGAGLTVWLSRELHPPYSSLSIGMLDIGAIIIAAILLYDKAKI